jgi:mannitol-specific phosphotransferase system IIBC component
MRIAQSSTLLTKKSQSKQTQKQKQKSQLRQQPKSKAEAKAEAETVSAGLAVCLTGFSKQKMYDSEYEEEVRKHAVMQVRLSEACLKRRKRDQLTVRRYCRML